MAKDWKGAKVIVKEDKADIPQNIESYSSIGASAEVSIPLKSIAGPCCAEFEPWWSKELENSLHHSWLVN